MSSTNPGGAQSVDNGVSGCRLYQTGLESSSDRIVSMSVPSHSLLVTSDKAGCWMCGLWAIKARRNVCGLRIPSILGSGVLRSDRWTRFAPRWRDAGSRIDRSHASERSVWPLGSVRCQLLAWNDTQKCNIQCQDEDKEAE